MLGERWPGRVSFHFWCPCSCKPVKLRVRRLAPNSVEAGLLLFWFFFYAVKFLFFFLFGWSLRLGILVTFLFAEKKCPTRKVKGGKVCCSSNFVEVSVRSQLDPRQSGMAEAFHGREIVHGVAGQAEGSKTVIRIKQLLSVPLSRVSAFWMVPPTAKVGRGITHPNSATHTPYLWPHDDFQGHLDTSHNTRQGFWWTVGVGRSIP